MKFRNPFKKKTVEVVEPLPLVQDKAYKLLMVDFISCLIDNDYSSLILSGSPSEEQIQTAWAEIYTSYCECIGGAKMAKELRENKDLAVRQSRLFRFEKVLDSIEANPCEEFYELLFSFGYPCDKLEYSIDNIQKVINQITPYYKSEKTRVRIESKESEGEEIEKIEYTRDVFMDTIGEIITALKVHISINTITVTEYGMYYNQYRKHIEALIKQMEKQQQANGRNS